MAVSKKQATLNAIKSRRWVPGFEIEMQGGDLRRLRELRSKGYEIKKRRNETYGDYEYRLVSSPLVAA